MFFAGLIVLLWYLLATGAPIDEFGWLMLVGGGWVAGYLDCRFFQKSDQHKKHVLPPNAGDEESRSDAELFHQS